MPSSIVLRPIVLIDPGATTQVMDATAMEYEDDTFDVIIDKSTLDALVRVRVHTHTTPHCAALEFPSVLLPALNAAGCGTCCSLAGLHVRWREQRDEWHGERGA